MFKGSGTSLLKRWTPVVLWMGVLFLAASQTNLPGLEDAAADAILKKSGHAAGYAVLGILAARALRSRAALRWRDLGSALALAVAYAVSDEFHQSFVPGRSARVTDILIDGFGASVGCALLAARAGLFRAWSRANDPGRDRLAAAVLLCLVSVIWGGSFIAARIALRELSPVTLSAVRFILASAFFLGLLVFRSEFRLPVRELPRMAFFGLLAVTFYFIFQYNGVARTSASLSAMVITLSPLVVVLLSVLLLRERLRARQVAGITMATAGGLVLVTGGYLEIGGTDYWTGILFLILNVLAWGLYNIIAKRTLGTRHPTSLTSYMIITGAVALLPFAMVDGGWAGLGSVSFAAWASVAYLVVLATIVAYLAYNYALQILPASQAGVFLYLNPVAAAIIANVMLSEPFTAASALGGALTIGGVYLASR